jgi:hypothetical protein
MVKCPFSILFGFYQYFFHFLIEFHPRNHDAVLATFAFDPDVCSHADNFPCICTARVAFFHFHDIVQSKFLHFHRACLLLPAGACQQSLFLRRTLHHDHLWKRNFDVILVQKFLQIASDSPRYRKMLHWQGFCHYPHDHFRRR